MLVVARVGTGLGCWPHAVGRMWEDIPQIEKKKTISPKDQVLFLQQIIEILPKVFKPPSLDTWIPSILQKISRRKKSRKNVMRKHLNPFFI